MSCVFDLKILISNIFGQIKFQRNFNFFLSRSLFFSLQTQEFLMLLTFRVAFYIKFKKNLSQLGTGVSFNTISNIYGRTFNQKSANLTKYKITILQSYTTANNDSLLSVSSVR